MGKYLFIFCAFVLVLGIWNSRGATRLIWFFSGILFFQHRIVLFTVPTLMSFHRLMVYALIVPELLNLKMLQTELKSFPLARTLLFSLIGIMFIGLFDSRLTSFLKVYRPLDLFIQTFFVFYLCYKNFKQSEDWQTLVRFFLISGGILCLYGFFNYLTKSNPIDSFISASFNTFSPFSFYSEVFDQRFRINSFTDHPIYYGYLLGVIFVLLFSELGDKKNRTYILVSLALVFLNLVMTNSRTPLFSFIFGLLIYVAFDFSMARKIKVFFLTAIIGLSVYSIPLIKSKVNNTIDVFQTGGSEVAGSSLAMRQQQMKASLEIFRKKPVFGNGIYFIEENLGYSSDEDKSNSADDLQGFESYIYVLLIEQGIAGMLLNILFFGGLVGFLLKYKAVCRRLSALGLAITSMFLVFSLGTGSLGSWIVTMGILGIIFKNIELHIDPGHEFEQRMPSRNV